ncbi:MAG: response regulator [Nitrospirota bacterium]|nr:response regulator [Nitrospirota bacterium]
MPTTDSVRSSPQHEAPPSGNSPADDKDQRERQVCAEQVRMLFSGVLATFLASTFNACLLAFVHRDVIAPPIVYGWLAYMLLVMMGRSWVVYRYWRAPEADRIAGARRWEARFAVGAALTGLAWGGAGSLLYAADSSLHQVFLAFVVGGMAAGGAAVLFPRLSVVFPYVAFTLVPTSVPYFLSDDTMHRTMGGMVILYMLILLASAIRTNRTLGIALGLRYDNEGLIRSLRAEIDQRRQAEAALRQSEEQLVQSQKMEAVGKQAGGIAHEFNNILQVIKGYCYFLLPALAQQEPLRQEVEGIEQSADRAATLTSQLLAFSRRQVLVSRVLDLNAVIAEQSRMLERLIGESVKLEVNLAPELPRVKADPAQIGQVLLNLVNNARDAMPTGGLLTMTTRHLMLQGSPDDKEYAELPPGSYAMVSVRDTGCGMPPEILERIFEPFFTTKELGKGTGLGLSTVYGLIAQIGGHIRVASQPGQGTCVTILLPEVGQVLDESASQPSAVGPLTGTETILIAEDEPAVRKLLQGALQAKGYRVLEAADGQAALQVCQDHSGPIHLAVIDLVMPGMGGRDLIRRLVPRHPNLKILYMSGYTDQPVDLEDRPDSVKGFLQKPFPPDVLLRAVRERLDAS